MTAMKRAINNLIEAEENPLNFKKVAVIVTGTAIMSFGLHNIHQQTNITEGGVLGMILLVNHWFEITPAIISPILDIICYIFAYKIMGKDFIKVSAVSTFFSACFFLLWEQFPPMLPNLSEIGRASCRERV